MMYATTSVTVYKTYAEQTLPRHTLDYERLERSCGAASDRRTFVEAVLLFLVDGEARLAQIACGTVPWTGSLRAWMRAARAFGAPDLVHELIVATTLYRTQDRRPAIARVEEGWTRTAFAVRRWMDTSYALDSDRDADLSEFLSAYAGQEAYAAVRRTWPQHRIAAEA